MKVLTDHLERALSLERMAAAEQGIKVDRVVSARA
jgi:hypothetical protein